MAEKQWFILHALSGQENKVRRNMTARLQIEEVEELFGEILVPTEQVSEVKNGQKRELTKKLYPGYVFVEMSLYAETKLNERCWHFVKNTPGVIGFIDGDADRPLPMPQRDVDEILMQIQDKADQVTPLIDFETGETVRINDGAFQNFNGIIEDVDAARGRLKVTVSIFGRETPVDLEYWQVEKAVE